MKDKQKLLVTSWLWLKAIQRVNERSKEQDTWAQFMRENYLDLIN